MKINEYTDKNNEGINQIWYKFKNKKDQILEQCFSKVLSSWNEEINLINIGSNIRLMLADNDLKSINKRSLDDFKDSSDERSPIVLLPFDKRLYFNVGCLTNISSSPITHKYMIWITCSKYVNQEVKVWIPCSEFCHAGHELIYKATEYSRGIWSCGSHTFKKLPINSSKNPKRKIENKLDQFLEYINKGKSKLIFILSDVDMV